MKARDVMVSTVITVKPDSSVADVAKTFLDRRISAVPVVDDHGRLLGIVSEGDLLHRSESGTERHRSWWLQALVGDELLAEEFVKTHSRKVADVMTRDVITATPETPLHEIAALLEKNMIKRVPIVDKNGKLVGLVSRANLIQAVAGGPKQAEVPTTDAAIREKLVKELDAQDWAHTALLNITVRDGIVNLWGMVNSATERKAILVAAESIPGVRSVNDNMVVRPVSVGV